MSLLNKSRRVVKIFSYINTDHYHTLLQTLNPLKLPLLQHTHSLIPSFLHPQYHFLLNLYSQTHLGCLSWLAAVNETWIWEGIRHYLLLLDPLRGNSDQNELMNSDLYYHNIYASERKNTIQQKHANCFMSNSNI